jgi:hypothetical protein
MKTTSLLDSVRVVKENEKKAAEFYADAAEKTGSTAGRELFGELAKFENYHYHWLVAVGTRKTETPYRAGLPSGASKKSKTYAGDSCVRPLVSFPIHIKGWGCNDGGQ